MKAIHFKSQALGTFDWQLPQAIAGRLEQLPGDFQKQVLYHVEMDVQAHLNLLLAGLSAQNPGPIMRLLQERGEALAKEVMGLTKKE